MKIVVLGGSPKGETSVTMQYVEYMKRRRPDLDFRVHQPALRIRRLEKNEDLFDEIIDSIHESDAVLWAFPLYVHGVCSQYQRFIELIGERGAGAAFAGKPAAALTTSINFFDHTAHDYIRAVSEDLGMSWAGNHSAHMQDLTRESGRQELDGFTNYFVAAVESGIPAVRLFPRIQDNEASTYKQVSPAPVPRETGKRIVVVTDVGSEEGGSLNGMIERFTSSFSDTVDVTRLPEIEIASGCIGCLKCGPKNSCTWDGKDAVRKVYEEKVEQADLYVIAARVVGRWHSALMKTFVDRGFFHTHQPFLAGKQVAVLLDGSLSANPQIRDYLTGFAEWQGASLVGIVAGEDASPEALDSALDALAKGTMQSMQTGYFKPRSFPGVAGMNHFRDEIFGHLRMVFRADHKSYRRSGIYKTFLQKQPLKLMGYRMVGMITAVPFIRNRMAANMRNFMLMPFRPALENAVPLTRNSIVPGQRQ